MLLSWLPVEYSKLGAGRWLNIISGSSARMSVSGAWERTLGCQELVSLINKDDPELSDNKGRVSDLTYEFSEWGSVFQYNPGHYLYEALCLSLSFITSNMNS